MESITQLLPLIRLISVIFVTIGVSIAVLTFVTNRKDKKKDNNDKKSAFYLERCEEALAELWKCFNKVDLDEVSNYTIIEILKNYDELKQYINVDEHKHALGLKETRYKNLIYNFISQAKLSYIVGMEGLDNSITDFDKVYAHIKHKVEESVDNEPLIRASNHFYGHLAYPNGANTDLFEIVASFITEKNKEDIVTGYRADPRALKSLRRRLPVFMAAYSYIVSVEQGREATKLAKPVPTLFKSA